ncbi:MAG: inositol monophosphatase [Firmicutes bacterium]|jgi:myo-inositol-1(or 4)-monophosphatase|nr:inositol monophosphatase [Bacillota bacterium]
MLDLQEVLADACRWAREIGKIQKEKFGEKHTVHTKSSAIDLVTEVDELSEQYLLSRVNEKYPGHEIYAEESGRTGRKSEYTWVIDPLDGTVNYNQGIPIFTISIALRFRDETVLGVIYQPMLDEMFAVIKGQKPRLNGSEIHVSSKTRLQDSILASGFPYDRAVHKDNNADYFSYFVPLVRGLRRMGAASYDLACVAAGRLDGYWELNLSPWDVEAGVLLVREAGGEVIFLTEKRGVSLIAGNREICRHILAGIKSVDEKKKDG